MNENVAAGGLLFISIVQMVICSSRRSSIRMGQLRPLHPSAALICIRHLIRREVISGLHVASPDEPTRPLAAARNHLLLPPSRVHFQQFRWNPPHVSAYLFSYRPAAAARNKNCNSKIREPGGATTLSDFNEPVVVFLDFVICVNEGRCSVPYGNKAILICGRFVDQ